MRLFVESKESLNNKALGREGVRAALRFQVTETENSVSRSTWFLFRCFVPTSSKWVFLWSVLDHRSTLWPEEKGSLVNNPIQTKCRRGWSPQRNRGDTMCVHREEGRMDTEQAKSTVVQYIVGLFFSFLFIIQTFFYFYNQWILINKLYVLEGQ